MKTDSKPVIRPMFRFVVAVLALGLTGATLAAQTEKVLFSFTSYAVGVGPGAGLVMDKTGTLYGTTTFGGPSAAGLVFKLAPPTVNGKAWIETTIYSFSGGTDGSDPTDLGALVFDKRGNLYGTTNTGGHYGQGTVFELTPPASGNTWTETILYNFGLGSDAQNPSAGLIMAGGVLYGTTGSGGTNGAGTVFKLTPPTLLGGAWTVTVLYSFTGGNDGRYPVASPTMHNGVLYGTTQYGGVSQCGVVYQLSPPIKGSVAWTETVLYTFPANFTNDGGNPYGAVILDKEGSIYGTTYGTFGSVPYGMVFKLTPPNWGETILYAFTNGGDGAYPEGRLIFDSTGALYGTTSGTSQGTSHGSVFKLSPPAVPGNPWTETTLHTFTGGSDGGTPFDGLVMRGGILYGTTYEGGPQPNSNGGVVFKVKP
jgi:uncharacterized repeat protein (TIGR03803 family)